MPGVKLRKSYSFLGPLPFSRRRRLRPRSRVCCFQCPPLKLSWVEYRYGSYFPVVHSHELALKYLKIEAFHRRVKLGDLKVNEKRSIWVAIEGKDCCFHWCLWDGTEREGYLPVGVRLVPLQRRVTFISFLDWSRRVSSTLTHFLSSTLTAKLGRREMESKENECKRVKIMDF